MLIEMSFVNFIYVFYVDQVMVRNSNERLFLLMTKPEKSYGGAKKIVIFWYLLNQIYQQKIYKNQSHVFKK